MKMREDNEEHYTPIVVSVRFRPPELSKNLFETDVNNVRLGDTSFTFDSVFDAKTSNETFYSESITPFFPLLLDGYNLSFVSYGQKNSGKTYTLIGPDLTLSMNEEAFGIIPRFVRDLFHLSSVSLHLESLRVSFLDVSDDKIRDLLSESIDSVQLSDFISNRDRAYNNTISGHSEIECCSIAEVFSLLDTGLAILHRLPSSSVTHRIFILSVSSFSISENIFKHSTVTFVDLAGSDSNHQFMNVNFNVNSNNNNNNLNVNNLNIQSPLSNQYCNNSKTTIYHPHHHNINNNNNNNNNIRSSPRTTISSLSSNVNVGLLSLNNVVTALGDPRRNVSFIPYNDSLLTQILSEAFGGNSVSVLLLCVSSNDPEETLNSLRFASFVSQINNTPTPNVFVSESLRTSHCYESSPLTLTHVLNSTSSSPLDERANEEETKKLEPIHEESETFEENNSSSSSSSNSEDFNSESSDFSEIHSLTLIDLFRSETAHLSSQLETDYEACLFSKISSLPSFFSPPSPSFLSNTKVLRNELRVLSGNQEASVSSLTRLTLESSRLQDSVSELKAAIDVKESLLQEVLSTELETKALNKKLRGKLQLLQEKSSSVRKELQRAQRTALQYRGENRLDSSYNIKIKALKEEIEKYAEKIDNTEKVLSFKLSESTCTETLTQQIEALREEQKRLSERCNEELLRKRELETQVERDKIKICDLESLLTETQNALKESLQLSYSTDEKRKESGKEFDRDSYSYSSNFKTQEEVIRRQIGELRDLKEDLLYERSALEVKSQKRKRQLVRNLSGASSKGLHEEEYRIIELDVLLEALDEAIDYKNDVLCSKANNYETFDSFSFSSSSSSLLLSKLISLSSGETKSLLHKFVYRTIDLIREGTFKASELESSEDERKALVKQLQDLNYTYSSREVAYEKKLDNQKSEHLRQLSLLRKQISDPDTYEFKIKSLKDELYLLKQESQRYKRFYKKYHRTCSEREEDEKEKEFGPIPISFPHLSETRKVFRDGKKLIIVSKPKRK